MANNGNNMNNSKIKDVENEIRMGTRNLFALKEQRKRSCNHKPTPQGRVEALHASRINVPNKKDMPESTVICTRCERYFDVNSYTPEEIESCIYMLTSMAEQIKLNAQLNESDVEMMTRYYDALDDISTVTVYYNEMVKTMANGNNNGKNNSRKPAKGNMGYSPMLYGGRGY